MTTLPRLWALLVGLIVVTLPRLAEACPQCAGRSGSGYGKGILLGAFMAFPFAVAYVVVRVIRKLPPEAGPAPGEQGEFEK